MDKSFIKKIAMNNLLIILLEGIFLILIGSGVLDFLINPPTGCILCFDENFFLFSHLFILLIYTILLYVRYDFELKFKKLLIYFMGSLVFFISIILFIISSLAGMNAVFIFVTLILLGIYGAILSLVKLFLSPKKK